MGPGADVGAGVSAADQGVKESGNVGNGVMEGNIN